MTDEEMAKFSGGLVLQTVQVMLNEGQQLSLGAAVSEGLRTASFLLRHGGKDALEALAAWFEDDGKVREPGELDATCETWLAMARQFRDGEIVPPALTMEVAFRPIMVLQSKEDGDAT